MAEIELTENMLIIQLKGLAKLIASANKVPLTIPLAHVVGAEIDPTALGKLGHKEEEPESPWSFSIDPTGITLEYEKKWQRSIWSWEAHRTIGNVHLEGGQNAFWDGGNPKQSIIIKLTDESYAMIVLKVSDPTSTLARIKGAVQGYRPS